MNLPVQAAVRRSVLALIVSVLAMPACLMLLMAGPLAVRAAAADPQVAKLVAQLKGADEKARITAIDTLGRLGADAKDAVSALVAQLSDPSAVVRGHAAHALELIGPDAMSAAPALAKAISDPDVHVRRIAVNALERIHPDPKLVIEALGKALSDKDPAVRVAALATLTEYSEAAVPVLSKALGDPDTRYWAALALGELGPQAKGAVESLAAALKDENPEVRREVLLAIARLESAAGPAVPALIEHLNDKDASVRHAAAFALGHAGTSAASAADALRKSAQSEDDLQETVCTWALARIEPTNDEVRQRAIKMLEGVLVHKQPSVQIAALRGLMDLEKNPKVLVPMLARVIVNGDQALASEALGALSTMGEAAVPALIEGLGRHETRGVAAMLLAHLGDKSKAAVPELTAAISDKDPEIRREVLFALASIGPDSVSAVGALQKALTDEEPRVQATAAYALGRVGPAAKAAAPALHSGLTSSEPLVRVASAFALVHVSPGDDRLVREALPVLIQGLQNPNVMVRRGSAEAIGQMGKAAQSAAGALKAAARDPDDAVRKNALKALEQLGVVVDSPPATSKLQRLEPQEKK